jgi:hypothetical protein
LTFRFGVAERLLPVSLDLVLSSVDALRLVEPDCRLLQMLLKCQHQPLLRRLQPLPRQQLPLLLRLLHLLRFPRRLQLRLTYREWLHQ